jgi:hypothetical protein
VTDKRLDLLRNFLHDNTTITVSAISLRLDASEESVLALLRQERIPVYTRAGGLWVNGRKPRPPRPSGRKENP